MRQTLSLLILLVALPAFAQMQGWWNAVEANQRTPAAGGGGGCAGVSGPPAVLAVYTNSFTSGQNQQITVAANSACNPMDVVFVTTYNVTISTVTNQTGQSGLLLTNGAFGGTALAIWALYAFTNPPATSHFISVTFSGAPGEGTFHILTLTNCSAGFGQIIANPGTGTITDGITNTISSASNELVVGADANGLSTASTTPTIEATQTLRTMANAGTSTEEGVTTTAVGSASLKQSFKFAGGDTHNSGYVCIKGF